MVRNLQKLWRDSCSIYNFEKVKDSKTKTTEFKEILVQENIPCRISFQNISSTSETPSIAITNQVIKLFLSNKVEIKENSKIVVTRNGISKTYKASGIPAIYSVHQEVILVIDNKGA
nr:MAG TPA: head closure knob [Caudoviricetes sp.]